MVPAFPAAQKSDHQSVVRADRDFLSDFCRSLSPTFLSPTFLDFSVPDFFVPDFPNVQVDCFEPRASTTSAHGDCAPEPSCPLSPLVLVKRFT